jgi:hypothetical protein
MPLTPNEHDAAAGYTETLTAVAVRHHSSHSDEAVPWITPAEAGIGYPGEVDRWLGDLPFWEHSDVHCLWYVVPEAQYQPLHELGITGVKELGTFDFLATKEDVAKVRAAMGRR